MLKPIYHLPRKNNTKITIISNLKKNLLNLICHFLITAPTLSDSNIKLKIGPHLLKSYGGLMEYS